MTTENNFAQKVNDSYAFEGESLLMGAAMFKDRVFSESPVRIPLKTLNRHGLISGATGTGKSKTMQIIAEHLSREGIPSLLMDVKGDMSGIAVAAESNEHIVERHQKIGFPFESHGSPVELLSLSSEKGVRLRATVTEFGPVFLSKIMGLNELQRGIMSVIFKYCDDNKIPLVDLDDLRETLQYLSDEGSDEIEDEYGSISKRSVGAIIRRIVELEQQGASLFFGEPSFEVKDLLKKDALGQGIVNILRVVDIQARPKLFSTFMLQMLAEVYNTFPEEGDLDKPKLVIFIDEAHLIFSEASKVLKEHLNAIIKLIRSKGIGIFFITQNPNDIPDDVLSQLGLKIQHALRAFTAKDRKAIRKMAQNFPISEYYDIEDLLTMLGIGEALITALNEDGIPTELTHTMLRAPESRMDILTSSEINEIVQDSELVNKYEKTEESHSAKEILKEKLDKAHYLAQKEEKSNRGKKKQNRGLLERILGTYPARQATRTLTRELVRQVFKILRK